MSVGIELVTNPSLLFLDEPTSGLDAFTALSVIKRVRALATGSRAVLMTIHQPRYDIVNMFTKVLLLSQGRLMFFGPVTEALEHFQTLGFKCPEHAVPTDFFLDVITVNQVTEEDKKVSQKRVDTLYEHFRAKQQDRLRRLEALKKDTAASRPASSREDGTITVHEESEDFVLGDAEELPVVWATSRWEEFANLFSRNLKNYLRTRTITLLQLVQNLVLALAVAGVYFNMDLSQSGVQNRTGLAFMVTMLQSFTWVLPIVTVFPQDRMIFMRERSAGSYRVTSYFFSKVLSELPVQLGIPFLFGVIVYWTTGLQRDLGHFLMFELILLSMVFAAQSMGLAIGAAVPDVATGTFLVVRMIT